MDVRVRARVLRHILVRRNLSQGALAELLGVTPGLVSKWMHGRRRPGPVIRQRLLAVLGVGFDDVFAVPGDRRGRERAAGAAAALEGRAVGAAGGR